MTRTPLRLSLAALLSSFTLSACLSVDDIEMRHDACEVHAGDDDPMIGKWQRTPGKVCEVFSNGRFSDDSSEGCGLVHRNGGAFDWARLDDGRYYFSYTNSFGQVLGQCVVSVKFEQDCDHVTLADKCGDDPAFSLKLTRVK